MTVDEVLAGLAQGQFHVVATTRSDLEEDFSETRGPTYAVLVFPPASEEPLHELTVTREEVVLLLQKGADWKGEPANNPMS